MEHKVIGLGMEHNQYRTHTNMNDVVILNVVLK